MEPLENTLILWRPIRFFGGNVHLGGGGEQDAAYRSGHRGYAILGLRNPEISRYIVAAGDLLGQLIARATSFRDYEF